MATMPGGPTATVTLPASEEILITREFAAPRHLVYRAWSTPGLVRRWWGGGGGDRGEVTSVEIDLRPGGLWRYVMTTADGSEAAFHGDYREIVPGERIVCTEVFESRPQAQAQDGLQEAMDLLEQTAISLLAGPRQPGARR
jgi:uncharacterized protein YndB with AHSA1/START domain